MKFSVRSRLVWLAMMHGVCPLAAFEMTALEFAARLRAARQGRMS
jgi:hypothetical protein